MRLLLLLLLLFPGMLLAQSTRQDSLLTALYTAKTDSDRIELNCRLSRHYFLTNTQKGKAYAQAADSLATATGNIAGKIKSLHLIGYAHLIQGEYDQGLDYQLHALKLSEKAKDTLGLVGSYGGLAALYNKIEDRERAHYYLNRGTALALQVNDKIGLSKIYNTRGNTFEAAGDYKQALLYFKKAATLQQKLGDKRLLAVSLLNVGHVHLNLNRPQDGLPYLFRSLKLDTEQQNYMNPVTTLQSIARIYRATGHPATALQYAQRAYELALKSESNKKIVAAATLLQELYTTGNKYEQALAYQNIVLKHQKILDKDKQDKVITEITTKYETTKKELENQKLKQQQARQEQEISQKNIFLAILAVFAVLLLIVLLELSRSKRSLKETYLKLEGANNLLQVQNQEINGQKNALLVQADILQDKNEQLARHNDFKNKVFSIISHDLRAPLNSIKGTLHLAESGTLLPEELRSLNSLLHKEVELTMNMLNNLLVWSKAQLTDAKLDIQPVGLWAVTEENRQIATFAANQKEITIINTVPETIIILTDKERLNFVLRNLLMNAIKFTFKGGSISIEAEEQDDLVTITVRDTGQGISDRNRSRIFTEQRFTTMGTSKEKGTGLGLMLCKELIESLEGQIQVESEVGRGSAFSITLPHARLSPTPAFSRPAEASLM